MRITLVAALIATRLATPQQAHAGSLQLIETKRINDRLTELTFRTAALDDVAKVRVLTPANTEATKRYPVL